MCGGGVNSDNLSGPDNVQVGHCPSKEFSEGWGREGLLGQFFVRVTQDGQPETDTGANQYQLATAADNVQNSLSQACPPHLIFNFTTSSGQLWNAALNSMTSWSDTPV